MTAPESIDAEWLDWAVADCPHPNETTSGDASLVRFFAGGALIAVVDGLGHGTEAANASRIAIETLSSHADQPVVDLVHACHEAMRGSRGCVLTLVAVRHELASIEWIGIGNVEAAVLCAGANQETRSERVVPRGGVVGYKLPTSLSASTVPFPAGSVLVMVTDGLRDGFSENVALNDPAAFSAARTLERYLTGHDDALVLVARHLRGDA